MRNTRVRTALFCAVLIMGGPALAENPLIFMPFEINSSWKCPQANGGGFSHTGPLYYSYDWVRTDGQSFNQSVYSPMKGTVHTVVNGVEDWKYNDKNYGELNNKGWGNMVLIKDDQTGKCLRLCHFKNGSIAVQPGQKVDTYSFIGSVGMTGLSTTPHVHMHLQNDCGTYNSVPFTFVEGSVSTNSVKNSNLNHRSSVLDENGAMSLGSHFSSGSVFKTGYWDIGGVTDGYVGDGYLVHKGLWNDAATKLTWKLSVAEPGFYIVFAKWIPHPNRDPNTKYNVFGQYRYRNQQVSQPMWWNYIGFSYLSPGNGYEISIQGTSPGTYIMADGIVLIKIG